MFTLLKRIKRSTLWISIFVIILVIWILGIQYQEANKSSDHVQNYKLGEIM